MGLAEHLSGKNVCVDSAPLIYFVEQHPNLSAGGPSVFAIEAGNILGLTSTITLSEVLVHPLRTNNLALAEKYREILLFSEHFMTFEILYDISEKAAHLRAQYAIRTPDALQIAGALFYGADCFLTNDTNLKKVSDILIVIVDDFLLRGRKEIDHDCPTTA